jgi:hypothetical protein
MAAMDAATIPLVPAHGRTCADLGVTDGSGAPGRVRALVDTGGGALLLPRSLADRLGLALGHEVETAGGVAVAVEPPELSAGDLRLDTDGVAAYALDDDAPSGVEAEAVELVLPAAVLRRHTVVVDHPRAELTFAAPGGGTGEGVPVLLDVDPGSGFARVEVEVGGEVLGLLLDTGASCCLMADRVFRDWQRSHPDWPVSAASVGPANMTGLDFEASTPALRVPALTWAGFTVPGVVAAWRPDDAYGRLGPGLTAPVAGSLGGTVLRHLRMELDLGSGRAHLAQGSAVGGPDADQVGVVVGLDGAGGYRILATLTGLEQVRAGDRLLAVGGEPVAGLTLGRVVDLLRGRAGEERRHLALERDGALVEAEAPVVRVL